MISIIPWHVQVDTSSANDNLEQTQKINSIQYWDIEKWYQSAFIKPQIKNLGSLRLERVYRNTDAYVKLRLSLPIDTLNELMGHITQNYINIHS